jgi:transcription antitermination factor NusG
MSNITPWFVLQTLPNGERKVERSLSQKGYECLLPTYWRKRRWSDRTVTIELPLFPRYIFCRFNSSAIGKAVSTPGVSKIVSFGGRPAGVSASEIEALQLLASSDLLREPWAYIPSGTPVKVETGPLAGVEGIICPGDDKRQLIISVTLLQRSVAIQLGEGTIVSVAPGFSKNQSQVCTESEIALRLLERM